MQKFLIIQTAYIGDVVLATALIEKLHQHYPGAAIDFLLRKGNESLLAAHPLLNEVLVWNKEKSKYPHLLKMLATIRARKYDKVINVQRFAATGMLTALSGAKTTVGFDKNPFSTFFTRSIKHEISSKESHQHEVDRPASEEAPNRYTLSVAGSWLMKLTHFSLGYCFVNHTEAGAIVIYEADWKLLMAS